MYQNQLVLSLSFFCVTQCYQSSRTLIIMHACLQLHTYNFKLIEVIVLYAMFVYLITETLPQLKLEFMFHVESTLYPISE